MLLQIITSLSLLNLVAAKDMDGFIVGGNFSVIGDFPHVAFVHIRCKQTGASYCGASILNQVTLLTAAHCLIHCHKHNFSVNVFTGSVEKFKGHKNKVIGFEIHENYVHTNFTNDVAMMILDENLKFGPGVQRIVLMKHLPKYDVARIAGWGWIDDHNTKTDKLKHTTQEVLSNEECLKKIPRIPPGTICGFNPSGSHPQRGDSGSALVIHGHIQIGIASHFRRNISNKTLIFTEVTYFYDWIQNTATNLFCQYKNSQKLLEKEETDTNNK